MEGGAPSSKICTFYRQGCCRFGDECRFAHPAGPPVGSDEQWDPNGDFPVVGVIEDSSGESTGSSRLGKWSRDDEMQQKSDASEVRAAEPPRVSRQPRHVTNAPSRTQPLSIDGGGGDQDDQDFQDVYASLPSAAISIPGLSRSVRDTLSGSSSPPDYGLSSSPQGISPEEEAALEDVRVPRTSLHPRLPPARVLRAPCNAPFRLSNRCYLLRSNRPSRRS